VTRSQSVLLQCAVVECVVAVLRCCSVLLWSELLRPCGVAECAVVVCVVAVF